MTATLLRFPASAVTIPAEAGTNNARCADPSCRARLTVDDANPTLGCWTEDVYCGDHLLDHIAACPVCAVEDYRTADHR